MPSRWIGTPIWVVGPRSGSSTVGDHVVGDELRVRRAARAERCLHRDDRLDRVVVGPELVDELVALRALYAARRSGVISARSSGEHRVRDGSDAPGTPTISSWLLMRRRARSSPTCAPTRRRRPRRSSAGARPAGTSSPSWRRSPRASARATSRSASCTAARPGTATCGRAGPARSPRARPARRGSPSARGTSRPCSASACAGRSGPAASPAAPTAARCSPGRARRSPAVGARRWPSGYAGHDA